MSCCGVMLMPVDLTAPPPRRAPRQHVLTGGHVLAALVGFFAVVIGVNAVMATLALRSMPGSEVRSAYEASQRFNAELEAARRQDALGWQVTVTPARPAAGTTVEISVRDAAGHPVDGLSARLAYQRPTDDHLDQRLRPVEVRPGVFRGAAPALAPGQWDLVLDIDRDHARVFRSRQRIIVEAPRS